MSAAGRQHGKGPARSGDGRRRVRGAIAPRDAVGRGELTTNLVGLQAVQRERVREGAVRQPRHVAQAFRVGEGEVERAGDVEPVGPMLGQAGRGQGRRLERSGRPGQRPARIGGLERGDRGTRRATCQRPNTASDSARSARTMRSMASSSVSGPARCNPPLPLVSRPSIVATTASSVWARCSTTSDTVQPAAADGDIQASSSSSCRRASSRSCSATRSAKMSNVAPRLVIVAGVPADGAGPPARPTPVESGSRPACRGIGGFGCGT